MSSVERAHTLSFGKVLARWMGKRAVWRGLESTRSLISAGIRGRQAGSRLPAWFGRGKFCVEDVRMNILSPVKI